LPNPLLVGELKGDMPPGFDMNNSPVELEQRSDVGRPIVMLSSSGTRLICSALCSIETLLACFRNFSATARYLIGRYRRVALIGAGSRGEFREEDQMCCAWIGALLMKAGYTEGNRTTIEVVERWRDAPAAACLNGKSAAYLVRSGQLKDLDFVASRIDDLQMVVGMSGDEVAMISETRRLSEPAAAA
jgi:2-phosphosulfolactate phosphatase